MAGGTIPNSTLDWRLAGTGGSCAVPSGSHEMSVHISYTNNNGNWSYTFHLPKPSLDAGGRFFQGYYASSGNNYAAIVVNNGTVEHQSMFVDGSSVKAQSSVAYYWR